MTMKTILTCLILAFAPCIAFAADVKYPVSEIPDSLKENAVAVVRVDDKVDEIINNGLVNRKKLYVITILNKNGDYLADFAQPYNNFYKPISYKCTIYDAEGKKIKKISKSDFIDHTLNYSDLVNNNRIIYYKPIVNNYPHTIEFETEIEQSNVLSGIERKAQENYDVAVQSSTYKLIVPKNIDIRLIQKNIKDSAVITDNERVKQYFWESKNLKAIEREPYTVGKDEIVPYIQVYLIRFELENYVGKMDSWENFGKFIYKLTQSTNKLSEKTISEVKALANETTDTLEIIKKIYQYLQGKTRFVSIQLGIGGYKPFDASKVDKTGYGDCKALTNYMKVLLDTLGIKSIYTIVNSGLGEEDVKKDIPCSQFNHVFLCVPYKKDTIWLECTNQLSPFNFPSSFTGNRHALLIKENGSNVVPTRYYTADQNLQVRKAKINLQPEGVSSANITTSFRGEQYENRENVYYLNNDDQKKWIYENIGLSNFNLVNWKYENNKDVPVINEYLTIELQSYASQSGKRLFVPLNILNADKSVPQTVKNRKTSFRFTVSYTDIDSIVYEIPAGYKPEFIPKEKTIETKFGKYSASVKVDGSTITYIRKQVIYRGIFPKEEYNNYIDFRKQMYNADNLKVALIK